MNILRGRERRMNEIEYCRLHGRDQFYDDLLLCWDNIELYNYLGARARRDFWKWVLKNKLGVECSESVYND
jgi:hypothetical protein